MGLFSRGKSGGVMNVIRCDEPEYLIWKWRPAGQEANSTSRENSIRWGSSLRVKDGEVAAFVYKQKNGSMQDFIEGPFDETIKTSNFPVLSSIVGLAYGGDSPFQAEVYFINLAGVVQIKFGIPYFDVADPRNIDYVVPVAVGGSITFNITDYKDFIKHNRLINFELEDLKRQIKDVVIRRVKSTVSNAPSDFGFPLVQIERKIDDINDRVESKLKQDLEDFGVNLKRLDISRIEPDKESEGWAELRSVTADITGATIRAQGALNIKNMEEAQAMNSENMRETLRIQREEGQYAQHLNTQQANMGAFQAGLNADVMKTGMQNLGQMGTVNLGGGGGGGMNPAGLMTGMAMGGALGQQVAGMMNTMGQNIQAGASAPPAMPGAGAPTPPPMPQLQVYVAVNGQQQGPFGLAQLQQYVQAGQVTKDTLVWKQGMAGWLPASQVPELANLFAPPVPGSMPPPPPLQ